MKMKRLFIRDKFKDIRTLVQYKHLPSEDIIIS